MEATDSEVLDQVLKIFMRFGIKSVTMDDISRELKISKKTLYKIVSDKPDLVSKVITYDCENDLRAMETIARDSTNAIEELLAITHHIGLKVKEIHPSIHYDLEKYYPEAWALFTNYKQGSIYKSVLENMRRGVNEGLYRSELNPEIVSRIHVSRVDLVFDGEVFPPSQFHFGEVFTEMMNYHIHGIASEKGIKYLKEKVKPTK